jgi:hypothetical protein
MNESPNPLPDPAPKPSSLVRIFLIVLPVGLAFMVPISLWIYYKKKYGPKPVLSQYAAMLRKDLNMADFTHYVDLLKKEYGEAAIASKEERIAGRARFIESTMDYTNMGYVVRRESFTKDGQAHVNLVAELPGESRAREVVLVTVPYDTGREEDIAALMCVAHALSGSRHDRTVRFAAVVQDAEGLRELRLSSSEEAQRWHLWIPITSSATTPPGEAEWGEPIKPPLQLRPFDLTEPSLQRLRELQSLIEKAASRS